MQPRNREQMRKVRGPQVIFGLRGNARSVARQDRRRDAALRPRHRLSHSARKGHAPVGDPHGDGHSLWHSKSQHGCAGIAHSTDLLEPRVALEIEAARLGRTGGRREMPRQDHRFPWPEIGKRLRAMQRHAHPRRGAVRRHAGHHHAVERQAQGIAAGAVDRDHPPLDRAVVAECQLRCCQSLGSKLGQPETANHKQKSDDQRPDCL